MHLLAATPGAVDDGTEPVDLGQTPSDVVFLSAADTELAILSQVRAEMTDPPGLRLASLNHLRHPLSVDMHLEQCATKSKLVVARILGGASYWRYGFEQFAARLAEAGVPFAALPGDDKPDAELRELSTVGADDYDALWSYFVEGGPENARAALVTMAAIVNGTPDRPPAAKPLLRAGLYWPGEDAPDLETLRAHWPDQAPVVPLIFYRALVQGAGLNPINRLVRSLLRQGLAPMPVFVASLKDPLSQATLGRFFEAAPPSVILNATAFAVGSPSGEGDVPNPMTTASANGAQVLQVVLSSGSEEHWETSKAGLSGRDIAMNVALPEIDGRVLTRAVSFKDEAFFDEATECAIATYRARGDRIDFVAHLAAGWAGLRAKPAGERKVALILANYPNKDGRLANGVGLDTPASVVGALNLMGEAGYGVTDVPEDSKTLMDAVRAGPTNWLTDRADRQGGQRLDLAAYAGHFAALPWELREAVTERWGAPQDDPFFDPAEGAFALSILTYGAAAVGVQPARGYNIDPTETYHDPALVPPHNYLAFYFWLRHHWGADALVHMGKHGNLEWLPGKALALSEACWPEAILGPMPHIYPFIVNDPGEGTQAKRRTSAVIIDHLTPPLTRAEAHGAQKDLEALVDEYYEAAGVDPRRLAPLRREILSLSAASGLDVDAGLTGETDDDLARIDAYLCDLKEAQIRDGLHIFGAAPQGRLRRDLVQALVRLPRGTGPDAGLTQALAQDLELGFDPLDCVFAAPWDGPRPDALGAVDSAAWRSTGDTVERLELLAAALLDREAVAPGPASAAVLEGSAAEAADKVDACGPDEGAGLLTALSGHFVAPAPSGAPTRGRLDVLPTGRNFFSVDCRAVPTRTAWELGWKSANLLIERHLQDHGDWPRAMLLTAWGTANMRTGGDDIAQALALMGVKPVWDDASRRVTGFEVLPLGTLGRPRVDVTLRISGFFRDAFPQLVDLVQSAAATVQALDEPPAENPAAGAAREGQSPDRVFGAQPGAYGAGLQAMIDERIWSDRADLAEAYLRWGSFAYGAGAEGREDRAAFESRLSTVEAIVQNQDNREHDILDSDDYYQFEGGAAAAVATLQGRDRPLYHNDHSRPERPVIRTLDDEIARVVRSRAANPKWIEGVKRHGYKGAFEMAATVDYLFAFAATTRTVRGHHFDMVEAAYLGDDDTQTFLKDENPDALREIAERLQEAIDRGLWTPRSNSARGRIADLLPDHGGA